MRAHPSVHVHTCTDVRTAPVAATGTPVAGTGVASGAGVAGGATAPAQADAAAAEPCRADVCVLVCEQAQERAGARSRTRRPAELRCHRQGSFWPHRRSMLGSQHKCSPCSHLCTCPFTCLAKCLVTGHKHVHMRVSKHVNMCTHMQIHMSSYTHLAHLPCLYTHPYIYTCPYLSPYTCMSTHMLAPNSFLPRLSLTAYAYWFVG